MLFSRFFLRLHLMFLPQRWELRAEDEGRDAPVGDVPCGACA